MKKKKKEIIYSTWERYLGLKFFKMEIFTFQKKRKKRSKIGEKWY